MRGLFSHLAIFLVVAVVPSLAQRGGHAGGHASFGGQAATGAHFGGVHVASHIGSSGAGMRVARLGNNQVGHQFGHRRLEINGYRRRGYGLRWGYPYGLYDPYWWGDSYSSYDPDDERDRAAAEEMNAENLDEQRMLADEDAYARRSHAGPSSQAREQENAQLDPSTVLIFQDGHQREIQNYAIVGSTLWNLMPQRTEKVPVAELDVPATIKANDDRGVDFKLPRAGEGQ